MSGLRYESRSGRFYSSSESNDREHRREVSTVYDRGHIQPLRSPLPIELNPIDRSIRIRGRSREFIVHKNRISANSYGSRGAKARGESRNDFRERAILVTCSSYLRCFTMLFKRGKRRYKKARLIFIWIPIATPRHSARSHKTIMFGFRIPPLGFLRFEQRSRSKRRSRNVTTTLVACIYRRLFITPVSPTAWENLATRSLKSLNDIAFSISR